MANINFSPMAEDTLETFSEIAETAKKKLSVESRVGTDSFATSNTFTGNEAHQKLASIKLSNREQIVQLSNEPAIARLVIEDRDGTQSAIYIARNANLPLSSGKTFASYRSPIGRLAEIPFGDDASIKINGHNQLVCVIEKTILRPTKEADAWDSSNTLIRHIDRASYSIQSLRALLKTKNFENDSADELDQLLEQADVQMGISEGVNYEVRTAMGLRDQPILDQFQGEIFRLPLDSQLIILGPPGTGKTTTLIKRLGQKLDIEMLESNEKRLIETSNTHDGHRNNWIMFTPSELLKHYLKEAFSREQVPASDSHIRTWTNYRNDKARNVLGILKTVNGGRFTLKNDASNLQNKVIEDSSDWFRSFKLAHEKRLKAQLEDGILIVTTAAPDKTLEISDYLQKLKSNLHSRNLIDIYQSLESIDASVKLALADSKSITEKLLTKERNRLFNNDKEVFNRLAKHLESIAQENEVDEEDFFDDDEQEENTAPTRNTLQVAVKAYLAAIRALARNKYLKRTMSKTSRSASIINFLGQSVPCKDTLIEIGRHISFQNGLRRFLNSHKRFVTEVPISYRHFRKDKAVLQDFYNHEILSTTQISPTELDAVILLMLKNSRQLLQQRFVGKSLDEPKFSYLSVFSDLFKNQIMVDEATDFSMLQLACMESLTSIKSNSFFACGDFNQRITSTGIRNKNQLAWVSPAISTKSIQLVYRQSKTLNEFASELLRSQDGDISALGIVPEESNHIGVKPVLCEGLGEDSIKWIAERILEVERAVQKLPTIAILVNSEKEVRPMADQLQSFLDEFNLNVLACEEGKALGEGTDIRVFDVQHIKGLEFEAVFFAGIDKLAEDMPELFERYLYVGATRAATYLGLVCHKSLPTALETLRTHFDSSWDAERTAAIR